MLAAANAEPVLGTDELERIILNADTDSKESAEEKYWLRAVLLDVWRREVSSATILEISNDKWSCNCTPDGTQMKELDEEVSLSLHMENIVSLKYHPYQYISHQQWLNLCTADLSFSTIILFESFGKFLEKQAPQVTRLAVSLLDNLPRDIGGWELGFLDSLAPIQTSQVRDFSLCFLTESKLPVFMWRPMACILHKLERFSFHGDESAILMLTDVLNFMPNLNTVIIKNVSLENRLLDNMFDCFIALSHVSILQIDFNVEDSTLEDREMTIYFADLLDSVMKKSTPRHIAVNINALNLLDNSINKCSYGVWRFYGSVSAEWKQMIQRNAYVHYRKLLQMLQIYAKHVESQELSPSMSTLANGLIFPCMDLCPASHFRLPYCSSTGRPLLLPASSSRNKRKRGDSGNRSA